MSSSAQPDRAGSLFTDKRIDNALIEYFYTARCLPALLESDVKLVQKLYELVGALFPGDDEVRGRAGARGRV